MLKRACAAVSLLWSQVSERLVIRLTRVGDLVGSVAVGEGDEHQVAAHASTGVATGIMPLPLAQRHSTGSSRSRCFSDGTRRCVEVNNENGHMEGLS
jgi:hypothetical protein